MFVTIKGGFNGRPLVQWPTRPLGGWALEAPRACKPGLTALPQTPWLDLMGPTSKGREGKGEGMRREGREEKGGEGRPSW